ncbi:MAG: SDR family oxidoreductase [Chloroflexota bacterium]
MTDIIVVTGGAGFIGSHVAAHFLSTGAQVRVVDNLSTGHRHNLDSMDGDLTLHEMSFTDAAALAPVFEGARLVYHIGALPSVPRSIDNPLESNYHNVEGTLNVLIAARDAKVDRVVYAASSSAYGDVEADYKVETMTPAPLSPYGVAKLAGEYYCQAFTASYGLETVCTRFFNVFGPRQDPASHYAAVIPKFIRMLLDGEAPTIFGDGSQSRDFTFIDNVVHGLALAGTAPAAVGRSINVATGGKITLIELVDALNEMLGTDIAPTFLDSRPGDILHSRADITRARELLGYEPKVTFVDGLARTVAWYRERHMT